MRRLNRISVVIICLSLFIYSCNIKTSNSEANEELTIKTKSIDEAKTKNKIHETLIIEGKDIWVRAEPSIGEVIMKLNTGDKCELIEKGKFEKIREMEDYWYKINFNGKEGWVYGSQTSIKQISNNKNELTAANSKELFKKLKKQAEEISKTMVEECECMYEISLDFAFDGGRYAFINYKINECGAVCNHTNYSILIVNEGDIWKKLMKLEGEYKNSYESRLKDQVIIVTENLNQNHLMEKKVTTEIFLFDERDFKLSKLNLSAKSCEILAPKDFGCDYCQANTTHIEELVFLGNPVKEVQKKITTTVYSGECQDEKMQTSTITYEWIEREKVFDKK